MLSDLVERLRAAIDGGTGPIAIDADGVEALLDDRAELAAEVERLNRVVNDLLAEQRHAVHELLPERERLKDEVERLEGENERLRLLNEDKFRHLQGYCKAADEDRATIARLRAAVASLAGACRSVVDHYEGLQAERLAGVRPRLTDCVALARAALAAAEPRPAGETEGMAR